MVVSFATVIIIQIIIIIIILAIMRDNGNNNDIYKRQVSSNDKLNLSSCVNSQLNT